MILFAVLVGVLGLAIGSFLNVVIYRVPIKKSIVSPPSACPHCNVEIKARDNVPVISWLLLRGRCRNCGEPISPRYPLVELGTGIAFFLVALAFSDGVLNSSSAAAAAAAALVLVAFLYLVSVTIALSFIDIDVHKLPNAIVLPSYIVSLLLFTTASFLTGEFSALLRAVISMAALGIVYFALAFVYPKGMGLGDAKLAGVLGIYLGWVGWGALFVGAFAAFLLGGLYGLILILTKRANRKSGIPFGPWMAAGAWLGVGVGNVAFASYLSTFGLVAA
jgi:leader peptidase (prepilin peptidase) / N-methyltransferase